MHPQGLQGGFLGDARALRGEVVGRELAVVLVVVVVVAVDLEGVVEEREGPRTFPDPLETLAEAEIGLESEGSSTMCSSSSPLPSRILKLFVEMKSPSVAPCGLGLKVRLAGW